jgi:valyl-tRNA synthetase
MSFPAPVALDTQPFKAISHFLDSVDTAIEPLCQLEVIAIGPRIVQVAINVLGLVDGAVSSSVLCLAAMAPLPESLSHDVKKWKAEALHFTAHLVDKIFRLIIATIPFVGTRTLSVLDSLEKERIDSQRIQEECDSIKAAKAEQDRHVQSLRKELAAMARMRAGLQAASEGATQHNFFVESLLEEEKQKTASLRTDLSRARQSMEQMTSQLKESEAAESRLREENQTLATRLEKIIDENRALKAENQYMHKLRSPTQSPKAPTPESPKIL